MIIKNYPYEFKLAIEITFEDLDHYEGFMNVVVNYNEYIIKTSDQRFWKCINCCGNNGTGHDDYHWDGQRINFYEGRRSGGCWEELYIFIFRIDNMTQLYEGGENGPFEIMHDFYSFTNKNRIEKIVYYNEDEVEVDLINFTLENLLYVKRDDTLPVDYNNYYFILESPNFEGQLIGIYLDGGKDLLTNGNIFKVPEISGFNYILSEEEKENRRAELKVKLTAYNYCPEGYKCKSEVVAETREFTFIIKVIDPPSTIPTTSQTEKPSDSIEQFQKSSSSVKIYDCLDNFSVDKQNDIYSHLCPDFTKDNIKNNLNTVVQRIDENKTYQIIGEDFIAKLIPLDGNSNNNNTEIFPSHSYINFTECEQILRDIYKIEIPRKIIFMQVELNNTNEDILVNQIEYQAYNDSRYPLDLSLCENVTVKTYYNFKNETKDEVDLISFFKNKGIDILDLNDNFFNDVCIPYSDSENDLTLNDRIKYIYKNYTFCEKNCKLIEIKYEEYKALCDCAIKENINATDFNFNLSNSQIEKKNNNFKIIKCHKSFASIKDNLGNIGFWIFLGLMLLNIILLFLYIYGLKTIQNYISKELAKHGYIEISDESHAFCHNYLKKLDKLILRLNNMKTDFIKKGVEAHPKHKSRIIHSNNKTERKILIQNGIIKSNKIKNKKPSLEKNIQLLKLEWTKQKE